MPRWVSILVAIAVAPGSALAGEPRTPAPVRTAGETSPATTPPTVELYTMGRGDLLFEKFGHAALCLVYSEGRRRTVCYNYGTTAFGRVVPLFWGFLRGDSVFWVSTTSRGRMIADYRADDRTLWRQVLPLPAAQARELEHLLRENAREENRAYQYHHYHDNCSSRLRDLLDRVTGGALSRKGSTEAQRMTYRALTRSGFAEQTSLLLLSDLMLGRAADVPPTSYGGMFLPDVLRAEVEARLGSRPAVVYERHGRPFSSDPGLGARWLWVLLALAFAAPLVAARRFERRERLALAASAIPLALIGLLLWFIAAVSSLPELRWNEALLVFLPIDAALPFLPALWRTRYALARIGLLVLVTLLLAVGVFRQPLWLLIPMPLLSMLLVAWPRRAFAREPASPSLAAG
ncbi:MAG TPA: DUF4105 domain-containing protein [Kofleriaceae bacterium]|nr:DUF4105 domain-containing protein [Kofleriaceae bacterium]